MSNSATVKSGLADILYMHEWSGRGPKPGCKCGWKQTTDPEGDDHVDHVADILSDAYDFIPTGRDA